MKKKVIILIILVIVLGVLVAYNIKFNKKENDNTNVNTSASVNTIENNETNNSIENNNTEENVIENIIEDNKTSNENVVENNDKTENQTGEVTIVETMTPSGFMGSSLKKVILYSNGEVYLINYNGEGYDEKNISSRELIAKNATTLKYKGTEEFEAIVVKGKNLEVINNNCTWIEFDKQ